MMSDVQALLQKPLSRLMTPLIASERFGRKRAPSYRASEKLPGMVNLIMFNPFQNARSERPDEKRVYVFRKIFFRIMVMRLGREQHDKANISRLRSTQGEIKLAIPHSWLRGHLREKALRNL
jgi:hypothetical protein